MGKRSAGVAVVATGALALTLLAGCGGSDAGAASPSPPSIFEEQQRVMRQAMEMAERAQAMQAKHMAMMERAMREAEEGDLISDDSAVGSGDD